MEETKKCPYCCEEILATAKKCKHCGEWFEDANVSNVQRISSQKDYGNKNGAKPQFSSDCLPTSSSRTFVLAIVIIGIIASFVPDEYCSFSEPNVRGFHVYTILSYVGWIFTQINPIIAALVGAVCDIILYYWVAKGMRERNKLENSNARCFDILIWLSVFCFIVILIGEFDSAVMVAPVLIIALFYGVYTVYLGIRLIKNGIMIKREAS